MEGNRVYPCGSRRASPIHLAVLAEQSLLFSAPQIASATCSWLAVLSPRLVLRLACAPPSSIEPMLLHEEGPCWGSSLWPDCAWGCSSCSGPFCAKMIRVNIHNWGKLSLKTQSCRIVLNFLYTWLIPCKFPKVSSIPQFYLLKAGTGALLPIS